MLFRSVVKLKDGAAVAHDRVASRLPPSAIDALRTTSDTDTPDTFTAELVTVVPFGRFLVGKDTVRVLVRPVLR